MTVPQHAGAPHRQQRFIELENVGDTAIPPFAALEVVDSYRPESAGGYTPDGGRTVLQVQLAIVDEPRVTVINGPCEIPVGGSGMPGTMHDPMVAMVYDDYPIGTDVGVTQGSFELQDGHGYRVIGDYDEATGTQRVIRQYSAPPVTALVELCAQEDAERNEPYECLLGTWNPDLQIWCYDGAPTVWAIDHREGPPHAQEGWKGLYQEMPSNEPEHDGKIYICVSLDCERPEEGCNDCEYGS